MARPVIEIEGINQVAAELKKRGLDVRAGLEPICHAGAQVVLAEAQERAPDSVARNLEKQTTGRSKNRVEVSVGPVREKHIARFVEYGTKPHVIAPKARARGRRKALDVPGYGVFRRVRHPGAKKQPFLRPAYFEKRGEAQDEMARATKKALRA